MHILIELMIICSMMLIPNLKADEIVCYLPNNQKITLKTTRANQQVYGKLSDITSAILVGSTYNPAKNVILFKKGTLFITPQLSTLLFKATNGSEYKAKMAYPILRQQTDIIVPIDEFITVLNGFGLKSILKNADNSYSIGKGIDPAIASTFAIPKQEIVEHENDEEVESIMTLTGEAEEQKAQNKQEIITKKSNVNESNSNSLQAIAQSASISNKEKCTITGIGIESENQLIHVTFTANIPIEQYQKPEIRGRELILRFVNVENGISSMKELTKGNYIEAFGHEKIRQFLLYSIRFSEDIEQAEIRKVNSKTITVNITVKKQEIVQAPKQSIGAWDLDVIVLDPGHGGEDAGAISINGYKEKDIALSIAKKVRELLKNELPATKVVMTRDDDTFIELYRRGQIANKQKGKLFISIHCNSMPSKPHPANGCESYILRPGRNTEAVRVAEKENSSIRLEKEQMNYDDMSEEKLIISTMAQSAFVKFSEKFAAMLQKEVSGRTSLFNRGVNQAGFLVLVGASMPNVLFETGFLSNVNDEKTLSTERGQQTMAEGIVKAIKRYANEYAKNN